jgi:murein DD-endopeptidase MepM/ murein hydrolase activator NlpD
LTSGNGSGRRKRTATVLAAGAIAGLSVGGGAALAGGGGVSAPASPVIKDLRCLERCLDVTSVAERGRVELVGKNLREIELVKLAGADGKLSVEPKRTDDGSVEFVVPAGAESGKPVALDGFGNRAVSPVELEVGSASKVDEAGGFEVTRAETGSAKSFYDAERPSRLDYMFSADGPTDIRIDVLEGKRERVVESFVQRNRDPFASHDVTWDGLADGGRIAPNGKYRFRVTPVSGGRGAAAGFRYYDHFFPLRGKHEYGDGLGAGRGHQGQDVFAPCGTKIVAARGGEVQVKQYHSAAGYYIVIDGRKTGKDYVYMHMERKGRPKLGSRVKTGEVIGFESDTGRASGCHLHFELWSSPGWYEGGHVLNPTKPLKTWDRWS